MTSPLQTIENTIISRLKNITVANGYSFDVGTVAREDRDTNDHNPCVLDIIIQQMEHEWNQELSCDGDPYRIAYDVVWRITGFHKQLDIDVTEFGVKSKNVTEDVMRTAICKSLYASSATWYTLGTTACKNAHFVSIEPIDATGFDAVTVGLMTQYRVKESDPALAG